MRGYQLSTSYHRDGSYTHHVTLYTQPWWRMALASAYHWYDMNIEKIPGLHKLEHWLDERNNDVNSVPICARRDIRCYRLTRAGRADLFTADIAEPEYASLSS